MSEAEVTELLQGPHKMQVATINPDGTPHLVTMYYACVDGRVAFWTYRKSQKAVNLHRDPRLTCLVETGATYDQFRGVQIVGKADVIDDYDRVLPIGKQIYARYFGSLDAALADYVEKMAAKRVVAVVHPERTVSWDHRKLAAG